MINTTNLKMLRGVSVPRPLRNGRSVLALPGAILAFLLLPSAVSFSLLGFQATGWAWLGGLIASGVVLAANSERPALPTGLWAAWFGLVVVYSFAGFDHAYQSAAQILCPIFVGVGASALPARETDLRRILDLIRLGGIIFLGIIVVLRIPMLLLGRLPEVTGLAPEAISSLLFQSLFLCAYLLQRRKLDLVLYLLFAAVPVVAVTRGPILGSFFLLIFVLAPLAIRFRITLAMLAVVAALAVFHTDRVQRKMFWSGQGNLSDVVWDNPDLKKSGRQATWDVLLSGIERQPWLGHGGNADASRMVRAGFTTNYLPHNDWLRLLYNYGRVGFICYVLTILAQVAHGLWAARRAPPSGRIFFFASLSAFVPYMVLMMFDNILIYAQFFGNLHFLMLGLAYGSLKAPQQRAPSGRPVVSSGKRSFLSRPRPATWRPRGATFLPARSLRQLRWAKSDAQRTKV